MGNEFVQALQDAVIFGVSLTILITTVVQGIKNAFKLEGELVRLIALGVATVSGSLYLIFAFPPAPVTVFDYIWRILAALVYSFTSPTLYGLLKQTNVKAIEDIEEQAVLGSQQPQ